MMELTSGAWARSMSRWYLNKCYKLSLWEEEELYVSDGSACLEEREAAMAGATGMQQGTWVEAGVLYLCCCSHWLRRRQNSFGRK